MKVPIAWFCATKSCTNYDPFFVVLIKAPVATSAEAKNGMQASKKQCAQCNILFFIAHKSLIHHDNNLTLTMDPTPTKKRKTKDLPEALSMLTEVNFCHVPYTGNQYVIPQQNLQQCMFRKCIQIPLLIHCNNRNKLHMRTHHKR